MEAIRTVAGSWLVDAELELPDSVHMEVENLVCRMTMVLSDSPQVIFANATIISTEWQRLRGVVKKFRDDVIISLDEDDLFGVRKMGDINMDE